MTIKAVPDAVAAALNSLQAELRIYGESKLITAIVWTPEPLRNAIERYLVDSEHPLAYQAGSQVNRIAAFVRELAGDKNG